MNTHHIIMHELFSIDVVSFANVYVLHLECCRKEIVRISHTVGMKRYAIIN